MDTSTGSFFDQLRHGLTSIEAKVTQLKALAAQNFIHEEAEESTDSDLEKVRNFENDIRSMHQDVMDLKHRVLTRHNDLDGIEHRLQDLSSHLNQFVVKNELQKYGYVPWVSKRPVAEEPEPDPVAGDAVTQPVCNSKQDAAETSDVPDNVVQNGNTNGIMRRVSSPTPVAKKRPITPKSVAFKDDDDRKRKDARSRHKLDLNFGNTPRTSFAPTANRRFTILPPGLTLNSNVEETAVIVPRPNQYAPDTSRNNPFANETTTRFNLPNLMQSYNLPSAPGTPLHMTSDSIVHEHETIEFTPGLTTRRPVAVRRCKEPAAAAEKKVTAVTNSFKNLSFVGTPTQPIPSRKLMESVKAVKSHGKMKQVGDKLVVATPQQPVSNIDPNLCKYLLRNRK